MAMSTSRLALVGVLAPPVFAAIVLVLTALEWDELHDLGWSAGPFDDPDAPWPSVTMLADRGNLQVVNFALLGVGTLALAVVLRRLGAGMIRQTLVALLGAGFAASAFRVDHGTTGGGGPETWNGTLHAAGLTVVVLTALAAMVAFAVADRDKSSAVALFAALACVAVAVSGAGNFFAGFLAVVLAWLTLVAARAVALSRRGSEAASAGPAARPGT